ncbi:MAG: hypothetical protein A2286_08625 [Gammaproteobacteria bacterium RIFOXYA12_FULL_61_12]|nr:MAG: hypothetical protein A2514_03680 [Gammaproteobacteria bacterium RIFOXYD12_FULL_61_37]OGT93966.1 MAG: hypothetical protein A2286_08625 [Gammaproteobacteria bacterium RIFOXYA12_FULL_61_12]
MDLVLIEGGRFLMGSPESEQGRSSDERQHPVQVKGFYLGKYPVTNAQYRRFKPDHDSGQGLNGEDQPVVGVNWHDAMDYADWLSRETGENYRLPTEAEWEYAARAGTTGRWSFGDDERELDNYAWYDGNAGGVPHPVGQKRPNPWGLYDMHGNVWEWTCSGYDAGYGGGEQQCAGKNDANVPRVARGGSWFSFPRFVRSANRSRCGISSNRYGSYGFRLARIISP